MEQILVREKLQFGGLWSEMVSMVSRLRIMGNLNQTEIHNSDKHCSICVTKTLLIKVLFILMTVILGCHGYSLLNRDVMFRKKKREDLVKMKNSMKVTSLMINMNFA